LTGAEVFYLASYELVATHSPVRGELIEDLDAARTILRNPDMREELNLSALNLQRANRFRAQLQRAILIGAQ
jgi:hypothetical protein